MSENPPTAPWQSDPVEAAAVAQMHEMFSGLAALLYAVPEARYVDPSGGYVPFR